MRRAPNELSPLSGLPPLPVSVKTKGGAMFDPRPDEWIISNIQFGANQINFHQFKNLTRNAKHKLKLTLARYVESSSYAHFHNIFSDVAPTFIQRERDSGSEFCRFRRVGQRGLARSFADCAAAVPVTG